MKSYTIETREGHSVKICPNTFTGGLALTIGNEVFALAPSQQNMLVSKIKDGNIPGSRSILTMNNGGTNCVRDDLELFRAVDGIGIMCKDRKCAACISYKGALRMAILIIHHLHQFYPDLAIGDPFAFDEIDSKKFWLK